MHERSHFLPARAASVWCSALLILAGCSDGGGSAETGRGVLLLAIDSLRADHTGRGGYDRPTTPNLDALCEQGVYFAQAFSAAPSIIPAHAAVLTGCDPAIARQPPLPEGVFGGLAREWRIPEAVPTLAREFLVAGFATAAFVDHSWLVPAFGFDAGFEEFYAFREGSVPGRKDFGLEGGATRFLRWLRQLDVRRDWFAYLTVNELCRAWLYNDPIWDTYFPPRAELSAVPPVSEADRVFFAIPRSLWPAGSISLGEYEARYDGALRRLDGLIHRLLDQLEEMGRLGETTVCVVGTFGLGFGESGLLLDHGTLSDVDLHVPWILCPAASFPCERGRRTDVLASTIDVAPTLLAIAGIERPEGMHGVSQVAALSGGDGPARDFAFAQGGFHDGFAVRTASLSYEWILPGGNGPSTLADSWFGGRRPSDELWREHLRDRASGAGPGDLEPSADLPEAARELHAAGEDWYHWIELARDALHSVPWRNDPVAPEVRERLVERGLIASEYAATSKAAVGD